MLKEKLKEYSDNSAARRPEEIKILFQKSLRDLKAKHITEKVIKVGEKLPDFLLVDTEGKEYSKADFKDKKLVLNYFRGSW